MKKIWLDFDKSPAAKAGIPLSMRQAAADRNAKFQAAKKSGNLAQYRQDNPKLSGREKAQQMARARIAAKIGDWNTVNHLLNEAKVIAKGNEWLNSIINSSLLFLIAALLKDEFCKAKSILSLTVRSLNILAS